MSTQQHPVARIYYGVPKFFGEWFRAVKAPLLTVLMAWLGVPVVLSTVMTAAVFITHSTTPMKVFLFGWIQAILWLDPRQESHLSPQAQQTWHAATQAQIDLGVAIFVLVMLDSAVGLVALFWLASRTHRFLSNRVRRSR